MAISWLFIIGGGLAAVVVMVAVVAVAVGGSRGRKD